MASGHGTIGIHFMPSDGHNWADFLQQKFNEDGYNIRCMLLDLTATMIIYLKIPLHYKILLHRSLH
jgi:hypothetical protein